MYNQYDFIAKLMDGSITVDLNGHKVRGGIPGLVKAIKEKIDWHHSYYQAAFHWPNKYRDSYEESMRFQKHAMRSLAYYAREDCIRPNVFISESPEVYCFKCGKTLRVYLRSDGVLGLGQYRENCLKDKDFSPEEIVCPLKDGVKPHSIRIGVPTGKLLFANFFREIEIAPEGKKYSTEFNLDTPLGRQNIARYLASQNVGYAQTGNLTVQFFKKGDEIIVTRSEALDAESELKYCRKQPEKYAVEIAKYTEMIKFFEGYEYIGSISCEVWRWMCADRQHLEAQGFSPEKNMDYVDVAVTPGTWELTDYYWSDDYNDDRDFCMTRLVKVWE